MHALAVVREDHEHGGIERARQVRIIEDDERTLPASSMLNFLRPAALMMRLPVAVEPVNEIARTSGCRRSASPASIPKP